MTLKWNKLYKYPKSKRELLKGDRHYDVNDEKLPSVTTILQATQDAEKLKASRGGLKKLAKLRRSELRMSQQSVVQRCIAIWRRIFKGARF